MSRIRPKAWLSHHRPGASSFKYHFSVAIQGVNLREGMQVPSEVRHASLACTLSRVVLVLLP